MKLSNIYLKFFLLVCSIILSLIFIDMLFIEPNLLILKTQKIYVPNWNKNLNGLKIGIITDLHIGSHFVDTKKINKAVKLINSKHPDVVFLLGDLDARLILDAKYSPTEISNLLQKINAPYGKFSIMGNHDYFPKNIIYEIHKTSNIPLLENQEKYITYNKQKLRIYGFKDFWHYKTNPANAIKKEKDIPTIVLAHNPDMFYFMPDYVSLTLSGHTHGGEINFPIIGSFFVPSQFGQRYRKGYIVENNKHLFVSGGVATISRMRFLNPPEVNILEIYSQTPDTKITNTKHLDGINKNYAPFVVLSLRKIFNKINFSPK